MKRLHYFNFAGVLALAALCVAQWLHDRRLNLEINRLEKSRLEQAARLAEAEQTISGLSSDVAQFKQLYAQAHTELGESDHKLRAAERKATQLAAESDQLRTSVTNWAAAVAGRDDRLKEANAQIRKLADDLNSSIRKFNALATNYNGVVKDLNELRARLAQNPPSGAAAPPRQPEAARNP